MFRTTVRRKDPTMLVLLTLALAYGGWRLTRAALRSLNALPRCNEDMVFF
jgi:heme A synthase